MEPITVPPHDCDFSKVSCPICGMIRPEILGQMLADAIMGNILYGNPVMLPIPHIKLPTINFIAPKESTEMEQNASLN